MARRIVSLVLALIMVLCTAASACVIKADYVDGAIVEPKAADIPTVKVLEYITVNSKGEVSTAKNGKWLCSTPEIKKAENHMVLIYGGDDACEIRCLAKFADFFWYVEVKQGENTYYGYINLDPQWKGTTWEVVSDTKGFID